MQTSTLQSLVAALFGAVTGSSLCIISGQGWLYVPIWTIVGGIVSFVAYQPAVFMLAIWQMASTMWRGIRRTVWSSAQVHHFRWFRYSLWMKQFLTVYLWINVGFFMLLFADTLWIRVQLAFNFGSLSLVYDPGICITYLLLTIALTLTTVVTAQFWLDDDTYTCSRITRRLNHNRSPYLIPTRFIARLTGVDLVKNDQPPASPTDEWWLNWRNREGKMVTPELGECLIVLAKAQTLIVVSPLMILFPLADCLLSACIAVACTKRLAAMCGGATGTIVGAAVHFSGADPAVSLSAAVGTALSVTGATIGLRALAEQCAARLVCQPLS